MSFHSPQLCPTPAGCSDCSCDECTDWHLPWYYRCTNWRAWPAALKTELDGTVIDFGVLPTPSVGGITAQSGTGGVVYTRSSISDWIPITDWTDEFTADCKAEKGLEETTGTATFEVSNIEARLEVYYRTATQESCRRAFKVVLRMTINLTALELEDEDLNEDFNGDVFGVPFLPRTRVQQQFYGNNFTDRRRQICANLSDAFVPDGLDNPMLPLANSDALGFSDITILGQAGALPVHRVTIGTPGDHSFYRPNVIESVVLLHSSLPLIYTYPAIPEMYTDCLFRRDPYFP